MTNAWDPPSVVLIVDDDPAVLSALRRALAPEPVQVVTTAHPKLALRWMLRQEVGLVISDRRMPGMGGDRFLRAVRRISPRTAQLLLTAYPEAGAAPPSAEMQAKPWDAPALRRTVRRLLQGRAEAVESEPDGGTSA